VDPYPPYVVEVSPLGDEVPVDSEITISFNEAMALNSLYNAIVIEPFIAGTPTLEGDHIVVFKPNGVLSSGTTYNVTVTSEAEDISGNKMTVDYSWEFTTEKEEVTSASPFSYDVLILWIFLVVILIIVLLVLYEFLYKRRRMEKVEDEYMEHEMSEYEEPQEMEDLSDEEEAQDDLYEGEGEVFSEGGEEGLSDEEPEYGDETGEEEEPFEEETESEDGDTQYDESGEVDEEDESLDDVMDSLETLEQENDRN
jgi:hypothetical protein